MMNFPMRMSSCIVTIIVASFIQLAAQNTVGLISWNTEEAYDGYSLFYPNNQSTVFLVNNCGEILHRWDDDDDFLPGNSTYLLENGDLIRCKRPFQSKRDAIWAGGGGAIVECLDWEGKRLWSFEQNNASKRIHHDIEPLPNGNVLMISWEVKSTEECLIAGRDTSTLTKNLLWPDYIFEFNPKRNAIVWEWHVWDHLIQDFDKEKENFGVVGGHPELVDINWILEEGTPDWMHTNSIDYNPWSDQIILSVPGFSEFWILDHSTTSEEARGHKGGRGGKGGDLLYRWGNPSTYDQQGTKKLFWAHDIRWIDDFLDSSNPYHGKITLFNNRVDPRYSTLHVLTLPVSDHMKYEMASQHEVYKPVDFDMTFTHPDTFSLHSNALSSIRVLPNENFLVCSGRWGRVFEINPIASKVVWEYRIPLRAGKSVSQGVTLAINDNVTFQFVKYPKDYPAFAGRDLSSKGYLENNPNMTFCDSLRTHLELSLAEIEVSLFPASKILHIYSRKKKVGQIDLVDLTGELVMTERVERGIIEWDVSDLSPGVYLLNSSSSRVQKILIY